MAIELATGYVSVIPSARGFEAALRRQVSGVGGRVGTEMGEEAGNGFSNAIGGVLKAIGKVAIATGAIIGAAGAGLSLWGLKSAAELQQTQIAFEGILGSGERASVFLDQLRAFAAKTPFEFPELAAASRQLLAVGFNAEDVIPTMTKLGNVAATLGVGGDAINGVVRALGQMKGKGKASAEELQQISEAIPGFSAISAIAQDMGVTTAEAFDLMAKGAIPADRAITAILNGMERFPGAAGAMERQSKTLLGVLSTLKDTARDALVAGIAPVLPAFSSAIEQAMSTIGPALTSVGGTFGKLMLGIIPILEAVLPVVVRLAAGIGDLLVEGFKLLTPLLNDLGPLVEDLFNAFAPLILELLRGLIPALRVLLPSLVQLAVTFARALLPVVIALTPALVPLANALAKVIQFLGPAGISALLAFAAFQKFQSGVLGLAFNLGKLWGTIAANPYLALIAATVLVTILVIQNWDKIVAALSAAWDWIKTAAADVGNFLLEHWRFIMTALLTIIGGPIGLLVGLFISNFGTIKGVAQDAVNFLLGIPGQLANLGGDIANAILNGFKSAWNSVADAVNGAIPNSIGFSGPFGIGFSVDLPDNPIPRLHSGGIFRAPAGETEGLALLRDREVVIRPEDVAPVGIGPTASAAGVQFNGPITMQALDPAKLTRDVADEIGWIMKTSGR